ncbi:response regulator [Ramlibacter henchirensis]|uniref:histidine kinase n=1 Tax=Ramlibacter henchirensis TaxID=204072 RepID=A0A4Z0C9I7_9BURK|nr:ATP-binding protein [Ramlibacter henchirensis]TFZ07070.1 response regulator [Ramlibacter henchirensis]
MRSDDEQFHLLVDAVRDYAIFLLDANGMVVTWNPGVERIKGYRPDELIGRHFSIFYTPEDRAAGVPEKGLEQARRDGRYAAQGVRLRKDGSRFFADVLITAVYRDSELVGFAKVTRDITERHRLEEQLRNRVDQLAEADQRKDEFIAMLAHELRNPLAPVLTGLSIVQRVGTSQEVGRRAVETMERQLKLMTRLVDDLLQISRLSRGKIELRRESTRLDAVVEHALEIVQPFVQARGQQLKVEVEAGVSLFCDPQRVVQALSNVVNNASKYTADGGSIEVRARRDGDDARITVCDSGIGIRSEMLERIFEAFAQDQPPAGSVLQGGLGIGLAVARTVMALHGGRIWARSEGPGQGATFELQLPLTRVGDHEPGDESMQREFRILVVDDNRDAANMIRDLLLVEGYAVEAAYGGVEALQKAEQMHPHMVLLDLLMPDITGYEVIKRVRTNPGGPVVVAVTGHGSELDREAVRQAGFDEHIIKPIVGEAILGVVRRFFGMPRRAPAAASAGPLQT